MFNFSDVLINSFMYKSDPIFEILEAMDSLVKFLSYNVQKSDFGSKHSPIIARNHNNITRNPSSDHCSFKIKFLPNAGTPQCA